MAKTILWRGALGILLFFALFWLWYSVAADYGYAAVSGTYILQRGGETSTLVLRPDHRFQQEVSRAGKLERAEGNWRRIGEGGIVFSKEFLKVTGQESRPDGETDAEIKKRCLGLVPSINLQPGPNGPTFHKKLLR